MGDDSMKIFKPEYYDRFQCLAGKCPDSCCKEWDVQVDGDSLRRYEGLEGELGTAVRKALREVEGETQIAMVEGRCPLWREDGLCRIQAELGEEGLCQVCRDYPRIRQDYGDFRELGLEMSCPEAARLILNAKGASLTEEQVYMDGEPGEYDRGAMEILRRSRERVLEIFSNEDRPIGESLALGMLYGYKVQEVLDGGQWEGFQEDLEGVREMARPGDMEGIFGFFRGLEILTPEWKKLLEGPVAGQWKKEHLAMARYLTQRYWLQAVADGDLYGRVKLLVIACLVVKHLGAEVYRGAQLFSKEIENDRDNVDAILDGAYTEGAFRDDGLLGLLLAVRE